MTVVDSKFNQMVIPMGFLLEKTSTTLDIQKTTTDQAEGKGNRK